LEIKQPAGVQGRAVFDSLHAADQLAAVGGVAVTGPQQIFRQVNPGSGYLCNVGTGVINNDGAGGDREGLPDHYREIDIRPGFRVDAGRGTNRQYQTEQGLPTDSFHFFAGGRFLLREFNTLYIGPFPNFFKEFFPPLKKIRGGHHPGSG
jgi:hypothetical protein